MLNCYYYINFLSYKTVFLLIIMCVIIYIKQLRYHTLERIFKTFNIGT